MAKVILEFHMLEFMNIYNGYNEAYPEHDYSIEHYVWERCRKREARPLPSRRS